MRNLTRLEVQGVVATVIALVTTALFIYKGNRTIEPQSVFTIYGAILGYVFGLGGEAVSAHRAEVRERNDEKNGPH